MKEDPRTRRLRADHQHIVELKGRSDFIDFEVMDEVTGSPPEKYVVTFKCRGIASIDGRKKPIFSDLHQVAVQLDLGYPTAPPRMLWLTPIWHPNVLHEEPRVVCIDNTWWAPGRTLDTVVMMLGEMVQYKNYHALRSPPYPLDLEVADWVLWAERQGILSHSKPVDERELLRPMRVKTKKTEERKGLVRILESKESPTESARPPRIKIVDSTGKPRIKIIE